MPPSVFLSARLGVQEGAKLGSRARADAIGCCVIFGNHASKRRECVRDPALDTAQSLDGCMSPDEGLCGDLRPRHEPSGRAAGNLVPNSRNVPPPSGQLLILTLGRGVLLVNVWLDASEGDFRATLFIRSYSRSQCPIATPRSTGGRRQLRLSER
jgi:hypothetical protein